MANIGRNYSKEGGHWFISTLLLVYSATGHDTFQKSQAHGANARASFPVFLFLTAEVVELCRMSPSDWKDIASESVVQSETAFCAARIGVSTSVQTGLTKGSAAI